MNKSFKQLPLGLPLTVSGIATIATIFTGKKLHVAFGAFWGLLSILHGLQHAGKLEHDAKELIGQTAHRAADKAEQISLHAFLAGNAKLADQVSSFVRSFSGVTDAKVALNTGSLLITYELDELRKNPHLANIETFVREHAKIR